MNLHYSQTSGQVFTRKDDVLLPYEFTLLSNGFVDLDNKKIVLLPYEFTLLSNKVFFILCHSGVLLPYEFTLLSNRCGGGGYARRGFITL